METKVYTPEQFAERISEELSKVAKLKPSEIVKLDMNDAVNDPIAWVIRNTMRIELARLVFIESIYNKFATTEQKRNTADLLVATSRAMVASLLRPNLLKAGEGVDLDKFAFIIGVDKEVLEKSLLETQHEKVQATTDEGPAPDGPTSA